MCFFFSSVLTTIHSIHPILHIIACMLFPSHSGHFVHFTTHKRSDAMVFIYTCIYIVIETDGERGISTIASFCHIGKVIGNKYTNSNINRISTAIKCRSYSIVLQLL